MEPLDSEKIAEIRALQREGSPDLLALLVERFLEETPGQLRGLRDAIASGDTRSVASGAHLLKGSSWALGAPRLGELFDELEALGRTNDLTKASSALARVEAEYARVEAAFRSEVGR